MTLQSVPDEALVAEVQTDFELSGEERLVRDTARDVFGSFADNAHVREVEASATGYHAERWHQVVELGWPALGVPEELGGSGGTLAAVGVLMTEVGRAGYPCPLLQAATAGTVAAALGDPAAARAVLEGLVAGDVTVLVAPLGRTDVTAQVTPDGFVLRGGPVAVEWAHVAQTVVVLAPVRGAGWGLFALDADHPGLQVRMAHSLDNERLGVVALDGVAVGPAQTLHGGRLTGEDAAGALARVRLLRAAELAGGAAQVLAMTADYMKERRQFGVPLGSFQAVQHHLADMMTDVDAAVLAVYEGLTIADAGGPLEASAAVAGYVAGRSACRVTITAAQLHGGIGAATEHPLHHFFRRAKAGQARLGTVSSQLERVADTLVLGETPGPW